MKFIDIKYNLAYFKNYANSLLRDAKNFLGGVSKRYFKKKEDTVFIERLYFGVTNICNARCVFCVYRKIVDKPEIKKGVMNFGIFKKALDEYLEMGGQSISLTPTVGDPLIDLRLIDKINYASQRGIKRIYFYTNGILLAKDDVYKKLIDSGTTQIEISTEGCDKEFFEKVYGVKLYDEFIKGVSLLLSYNKEKGEPVKISINFRSARKPSEVLGSPDFVKIIKPYLSKKVSYSFMIDYDNWGGEVKKEELVGVMKMRRRQAVCNIPCARTFDAMILFDGSVRLCSCRIKGKEFDDLVIGNILNDSLKNIYYGIKAKKLREDFFCGKKPEVCIDCSLYMPVSKKWFELRKK